MSSDALAHAEIVDARKVWATLRAKFALRGFALDRLAHCAGFRITRAPGFTIDVPSMGDVLAFAERAGIEV